MIILPNELYIEIFKNIKKIDDVIMFIEEVLIQHQIDTVLLKQWVIGSAVPVANIRPATTLKELV